MSPQEIADILKASVPDAVVGAELASKHPSVTVAPEKWHQAALVLRDEPRLGMNMLRCISALDLHPEPWIELVYDLISMRPPRVGQVNSLLASESQHSTGSEQAVDLPYVENAGTIAVRVRVPREGGAVRSVGDVWPAAEWHEREAYDLLGVQFEQHPDLRRILCPDDWRGFPLRKDYEFPKEYHGIPSAATEE
ncbi:MAG: NADH-quinone oxidoreductase subunit C [Planctomycetota bacterium]